MIDIQKITIDLINQLDEEQKSKAAQIEGVKLLFYKLKEAIEKNDASQQGANNEQDDINPSSSAGTKQEAQKPTN